MICTDQSSFSQHEHILTKLITNIKLEVRRRVPQCYMRPILLYGCEFWTVTKSSQNNPMCMNCTSFVITTATVTATVTITTTTTTATAAAAATTTTTTTNNNNNNNKSN